MSLEVKSVLPKKKKKQRRWSSANKPNNNGPVGFCTGCQIFFRRLVEKYPNFYSPTCPKCFAVPSLDTAKNSSNFCQLQQSNETSVIVALRRDLPPLSGCQNLSQICGSEQPSLFRVNNNPASVRIFTPAPPQSAYHQHFQSSSSSCSSSIIDSNSNDGPVILSDRQVPASTKQEEISPNSASELILNVIRDVSAALLTWRPSFVEFVILKAMLFYRTDGPFSNANNNNSNAVNQLRGQLSRALQIYFSKTHRQSEDAAKAMQQFIAVYNMLSAVSKMRGEALEGAARAHPEICSPVLGLLSELFDTNNEPSDGAII